MRRALGLALVLAAALPARAGAALVYTRQGTSVQATPRIFAAADDGSAPLRIAAGYDPQVSPDGPVVAYLARPAPAFRDELRVVPAAGGRFRRLLSSAQIQSVRLSPFTQGLSWSPSGEEIVYGRGENDSYTAPSDLYAVPARGGEARRLTADRRSLEPVWGAVGIAYGRTIRAHTRGPDPSLPHDVVAVPWGGGRARLLARRASFLDWTR